MNRATVDVTRHAQSPIWQSYDTSRNHRWFSAAPGGGGGSFIAPPSSGSQSYSMPSPLQRHQQAPQRLYQTTTIPSTNPLINQRSTMLCSSSTSSLLPPPQPQRRTNIDVMTGMPIGSGGGSRMLDTPLHHSAQLAPPPSRVVLGSPSQTTNIPPAPHHMKINAPIIGLAKTQIIQREIPSFLSQESAPRPGPEISSAAAAAAATTVTASSHSLPVTQSMSTHSTTAADPVIAFGPLLRGSRKFLLRRLDTQLDCALLIRLDPDCFVAIQCKYTDDKNTLQQRCAAFVKAHNLKAELVLRGLYQKCFTMLKKRERLLAKKMASIVRLLDDHQEVKEMYYSIVDIIALME